MFDRMMNMYMASLPYVFACVELMSNVERSLPDSQNICKVFLLYVFCDEPATQPIERKLLNRNRMRTVEYPHAHSYDQQRLFCQRRFCRTSHKDK